MNKFLLLALTLILTVACGKPKKYKPMDENQRGIWYRNSVSSVSVQSHAPIYLTFDTTQGPVIHKVNFKYTTKDVALHSRILTVDKEWVLSIRNFRLIDCSGPDGRGLDDCRIEFIGVPAGTYLFEY